MVASDSKLILIAGLGNPGKEYDATRHNAGFMAVDEIVRRYDLSAPRSKYKSELSEGRINGIPVLMMKPQTFMNKSGVALQEAVRFYKIPLENVIVLYDELDLPIGKVKAKTGGGDGGHNGIKSIDAHISKGYRRIRIGIDHPGDKGKVTSYVLNRFAKAEQPVMQTTLDAIAEAIPAILTGTDTDFTTKLALIMRHSRESGNPS